MAGVFKKLIDSMKLPSDEDYDDEDEFEPDEDLDDLDYSEDSGKSYGASYKTARTRVSYDTALDLADGDDTAEETRKTSMRDKIMGRKAVPTPVVSMKSSMEVCMIKPINLTDAKEICDVLLLGKAVVINMEGLNIEMAQRIIDFVYGACYSMNGNFQTISKFIFIVAPGSISLSGDFARSAVNSSASSSSAYGSAT